MICDVSFCLECPYTISPKCVLVLRMRVRCVVSTRLRVSDCQCMELQNTCVSEYVPFGRLIG